MDEAPRPPDGIADGQSLKWRSSLLAWWRERRLRLEGLPGGVRLLVVLALLVLILGDIAILLLAFRIRDPFGIDQAIRVVPVPRLMTVLSYLGLAVGAAAFAMAAHQPGWHLRRFTLVVVGYVGLAVAGLTVDAAGFIRAMPTSRPWVLLLAGWLGIVAALGVALVPLRLAARRPWLLSALAAAPFLLGLVAYAGAGRSINLSPAERAQFPDFPSALSPRAETAGSVVVTVTLLGFAVAFLLLWQAAAGVRGTRDLAVAVARWSRLGGWVLGVALALKLLWMGLGYTGLLPRVLGGDPSIWSPSRHDGLVSWGQALLLAVIVAWWLVRRPAGRIDDGRLSVAAWGLALSLTLLLLVGAAAILLQGVIAPLPGDRLGERSRQVVAWVTEQVPWNAPLVVWTALPAGLVLLLWPSGRRDRSFALLLLAFAAWSLPRAVVATRLVLDPKTTLSANQAGLLDLVTLDTAITLTVAALAVLWWLGRQRGAGPGALLAVLVTSTVLAHHASLTPLGWRQALFYAALVFPTVYQFLFDAEPLNRPGPARVTRVLAATGMAAVVVTIAATRLAIGFDRYSPVIANDPGRMLFAVPFAAILLAAHLQQQARPVG
jgi:hypothetical protein